MPQYEFRVSRNAEGEWAWRLFAPDGAIVAVAPLAQPTRQDCVESIREFRRLATYAAVIDVTEPGASVTVTTWPPGFRP
jgi:uncharacterized protein YegP (UPF0339 family)